ncbi:MAG: hypothetical protein ACPHTD_07655, partial [Gammaproteobacteria bacterium]
SGRGGVGILPVKPFRECCRSRVAATMRPVFFPETSAYMELNAVYNALKDMQKRIDALRGYL